MTKLKTIKEYINKELRPSYEMSCGYPKETTVVPTWKVELLIKMLYNLEK